MPYGSNFPSLNFRTTGAWGAGNGTGPFGRLTNTQADANIDELGRAVEDMRDNPPAAIGISNITSTASSFTVHLADSTTFGPFILPVAQLAWQGDWTAATAYQTNDLVTVAGDGVYMVLQDHTSAASFDSAAADSDGAIYSRVFGLGISGVGTISATTDTAALDDNNKYNRCTNSAGCVITIPKNADVAFPLGAVLTYEQGGADPVSIVGDSDSDGSVTVNVPATKLAETAELYGVVSVIKIAADTWTLIGYLAEAGSA